MSINEGSDSGQLSRWKFSLRTLLLSVVIVCLAIPLVLQSFKLRSAEAELRQLRNETGRLTIGDPKKVHVIAVDMDEPNTWRWKMFLPKGVRYSWCLGYGRILGQGVPSPMIKSTSAEPYSESDAEVVIDARLRQMDDGHWLLSVSSRIGDRKDQMKGARASIPDEDMRWTREVWVREGTVLGSRGTEVLDPSGPIILLRSRAREKRSDGTFQPLTDPMSGYMIWLEREQ
jgi:hypothetical protein